MFKWKRSGLLRRLWKCRLVTESDGQDGSRRGEGGRNRPCCRKHSEKLHRHEQVTYADPDPAPGLTGEAGDLTGSAESGDEEQDDDQGDMYVQELRHDSDSGTVTCCLFRERDLGPRRTSSWTPRKEGGGACQCAPRHAGLEDDLGSTAHAFLRRLKERPLDALVKAVETRGGVSSECVMAPGAELRLGAHRTSPQNLLCRLYRWSDLPLSARLKALCHCQSFGAVDRAKVCCNPYHYSRLCGPETPPPPYSLPRLDGHKPLDSSLSYTAAVPPLVSSPTVYADTGSSLGSSASHWCSVAYWEHRTRVGRLYPAHEASLSIFYDLPQGTGLCLSQLHTSACVGTSGLRGRHGGASAQHIRRKIGFGIVLSREADSVWLYNRSQHPVFVHSATLDPPGTRGLAVKRVTPGFSLKVFDYERSSWMRECGVKPESHVGPWDPHSVRISFAKGWGPCYSRQFITSCPCWLEVLLHR